MFFTLKNRGKLCTEDVAHELYEYRDEIFDFFTRLNYVLKNEDKIILNYTKKADISDLEILDEL